MKRLKKSIREWAFNLFTKRITIKVAKLPDDAKIEYLANKFLNELVAQGHNIDGTACSEYITIFGHGASIRISTMKYETVVCKRLTNI